MLVTKRLRLGQRQTICCLVFRVFFSKISKPRKIHTLKYNDSTEPIKELQNLTPIILTILNHHTIENATYRLAASSLD